MLTYLRQLCILPSGQFGVLLCLLTLTATPAYSAPAVPVVGNLPTSSLDNRYVPTVPGKIAIGTFGEPATRPRAGHPAQRVLSGLPAGKFLFNSADSGPVAALRDGWTITASHLAMRYERPDNGVYRKSPLRSVFTSRSISDLTADALQSEREVRASETEPNFCHANDPFRVPSKRIGEQPAAAPAAAAAWLFSAGLVTLIVLTQRGNNRGTGR